MIDKFLNHLISWAISGFLFFVGLMLKKAVNIYKKKVTDASDLAIEKLQHEKEQAEKERLEQNQLKEGLLSLLRYRINRICAGIKEKGEMTLDEQTDLQDMFSAYEQLGGNGRTKRLYQEIIKMKLKL